MPLKKSTWLVLCGYGLLAVSMTWPTVTQMTSAIPGDGFDGWQNYWNLWWIKEALLNRQTHFFFTTILYPPQGASLLFHTLNFFNGLSSLPVQLNFGLAVAYNAIVFFHFTFSGYGVYLLAHYVLNRLGLGTIFQRRPAAFVAGVIFAYAPFHMAHLLGHMQVFSLTWPPFYVLWLLRTLDRWRLNLAAGDSKMLRGIALPDLGLTLLFLILTTTVDWYQTLYLLLFTGLALLWTLWTVWRSGAVTVSRLVGPVVGLLGLGLVFGLLFSPLIVPMAVEASTADYMRPTFEENVILSADLLAFFLPGELHPLWGRAVQPLYNTFSTTTSERLVFAGFVPLLLSGYAVWRERLRATVRFWLIFVCFFFLLALGPYLHVAGQIVRIGDWPVPMPYLLLYKVVPFIGISRSLSRYDLMVMIGLAVLSAIALARLRPALSYAALGLICFEFLVAPFPMSRIDTPDFFRNIANDGGNYNIAALPMNWDRPSPLLYQTVHHKGLLTAYTSRQNPLDLTWRTPVLQQWRGLSDDIIQTDLAAVAPTILSDFNVKYIVLDYYQMPPGPERVETEKWVAAALPGAAPVYDDSRLKVYEAPTLVERQPYLQLDQGWGTLDHSLSNLPVRWVETEATLKVIDGAASARQLEISTTDPYQLTGLIVDMGDTPLPVLLTEDGRQATIPLSPQAEIIRLKPAAPLPISRLRLIFAQ